MSISDIQRQTVLDEVARFYFANGEAPTTADILRDMSLFFSEHPVGVPFNIEPNNIRTGLISNVDEINSSIMRAVLNMSILYESVLQDTDKSMSLYTIAQTKLENLRVRRSRIESNIDDFLLTLSNTEGYFYSFSDYFSTLDFVDLDYTSAFVDILSGQVSIPPIAEFSTPMPGDSYAVTNTIMKVNGEEVSFQTDGPFENAVDGLSNTNWAISTSTSEIADVEVEIRIQLSDSSLSTISKVEIDPFTMVPVQIAIETENSLTGSGIIRDRSVFGEFIKSGSYKMTFIDTDREANVLYITMRKTEPDYELQSNSTNSYVYVFGASYLEVSRQSYDNAATFVSDPIALPEDIASDHVIDALVLSVDDAIVGNTNISYFIAKDEPTASSINDFGWNKVYPLEDSVHASGVTLRLDGAVVFSHNIKEADEAQDNELSLIPLNSSDSDTSKRNPTSVIVDGVNIYRISEFREEFIPQTVFMEEGINSTRILTTSLNSAAVDGLSYWTNFVNGSATASEYFGRIDTGNEFFYGGDVGANNLSVYVETFVDSLIDRDTMIKEFRKSDANSQQWEVYVYLNGRKIGSLPSGTDTALLPWKFNEGLNHIALTINIPASTESFPSPYLGTVDLMVQEDLNVFGTVKLANWTYVDLFKMTYNETGEPKTFTINNGEIISRRQPTTNFKIHYAKPTGHGVDAIRLRADLERTGDNDSVTPIMNSYSIRFSYGDGS